MITATIDGMAFRHLVKNGVIEVSGYDDISRAGPARGVPVKIVLKDIGFKIMFEAIREAAVEKDQTDKDPNTDPTVP